MALPTFQAAGAKAEGTTTCAPAWPAHQALDIGLLFVEVRFGDDVPAPGESWVQVENSPQVFSSGGTSSTTLAVFWKRAASSAETAPTLNAANHIVAQILTYRGCVETGDPWEAGAGGGDVLSTASTSVAVPGGETTVDDCLVVAACGMGQDTASEQFSGWANADLANVLERADSFTALGNGGGFGVATGELVTAGTFGTTTATSASSFAQARISLALKPAPAGGTEHFGAASLGVTAGVTTAAKKDAHGAAAMPTTLTAAVTAKKDAHGAADLATTLTATVAAKKNANAASSLPVTFTVASAGKRDAHGAAALGLTFAASTTGKKNAHGATAVPLVFTVDVSGTTGAAPITGAASLQMTFGASVSGKKDAHGAASLPLAVSVATQGTITRNAAASLALTLGVAVTGKRTAYGAATLPLVLTFTVEGIVGALGTPPVGNRTRTSPGGGRTLSTAMAGLTLATATAGLTLATATSGRTLAAATSGQTTTGGD